MGKEYVIASSYHKGYCLEFISEEAKSYIYQEVINHGGMTSLGIHPSSFVRYLLFLRSYISMQKLAETGIKVYSMARSVHFLNKKSEGRFWLSLKKGKKDT